ncbi:MAG: Glycine cleavage system transcriptional activator [Burkholderia lata]|uniref:Glycine cleavage system transcriptional activator n=1 Tax=Burkholderia lata (strain ATCC 17760 / DSM 23089 / LMG 22485 / NCIMB 9086 / R18194 / 383) TaxID=482957 RepID=A0A833PRL4_BURL3|nr:LysR substrate-binding domain-containing protein [Burkholderia lata]KAF1036141.1 MAG: Glycine cleavage system transcriptional activator [Burkholderia lata]
MTLLRKTVGSLNRLIAFEAAARHCNFTRAAEELCISQPAVSRQIKELEQALGMSLFVRFGTKLELNDAGTKLLSSVTSAFNDIEHTAVSLRTTSENSVVRLRVSVAASQWLLPASEEFYAANPDILLQLICVDEPAPSGAPAFDLEVRFGNGKWQDGIVYPLLDEVIFPVASAGFLKKHAISSQDDLLQVPLLQLTSYHSPLMDWLRWLPHKSLGVTQKPTIRTYSTYSTLLDAAMYGHGVALGWKYYVADALERGDLRIVLPMRKTSRLKEFLVVSRQRADTPAVKRTADWIRAYADATCRNFSQIGTMS